MNFLLKWFYRFIYLTKGKIFYAKCNASKNTFPNKCQGSPFVAIKSCYFCNECPYYNKIEEDDGDA